MAAVMTGVLIALVICLIVSVCGGFKKKAKPWGPKVLLGIWAVLISLVVIAYISAEMRGGEHAELATYYFPTNISLAVTIGVTFYIYWKMKTKRN